MPEIIQVPSPLFGYPRQGDHGRLGKRPVAICHHTMAGWWSYYQRIIAGQVAIRNSANYSINVDGSIHQHVADEDAAWCNGVDFSLGLTRYKSDLTLPWLKEAWDQKASPNLYTISIELEGLADTPLTEPQYASLRWLDDTLCTKHGIPRQRNPGLVGHYQIDCQKVHCPGSAFPWDRLVADLRPPAPAYDPAYDLVSRTLRDWLLAHPEVGTPRFPSFDDGTTGCEMVWCAATAQHRSGPLVVWRQWIPSTSTEHVKVMDW